jgi:transcription initiation factor TFIIF subunit beta
MPRYLLERWSAIDAEDVHLATIRVYPDALGPGGKKPRIVLFLPPDQAQQPPSQSSSDSTRPASCISSSNPSSHSPSPSPPSGDSSEPDAYDLEMIQESVENQMVVAERPKDPSFGLVAGGADVPTTVNTRARTTILTGRVKHECNLRPLFTDSYRRQMRERHRKYNTPRRQIMRIEEAGVSGGRGGINRLSSGAGVGAGNAFGDLIVREKRVLLFFSFSVFIFSSPPPSRNRDRSLPRGRSSGWRVSPGTSCSISSLRTFGRRLGGGSRRSGRRLSSLRPI